MVFGGDEDHPAIKHLNESTQDYYVGGRLDAIDRLMHYDYVALRCKSLHHPFSKLRIRRSSDQNRHPGRAPPSL